jgi:hypothetical protein
MRTSIAVACIVAALSSCSTSPRHRQPPPEQWTRTFFGRGHAQGYSVQQTQDGGYVAAGWTRSVKGTTVVYVVRTDSAGNPLWVRTCDTTSFSSEARDVKQTRDRGFIVVGTSVARNDQVLLLKLDSAGNEQWEKRFDRNHRSEGRSVSQTPDGGYIIGAYDYLSAIWVIRTDSAGDIVWDREFPSHLTISDDALISASQTRDGGYVVCGHIGGEDGRLQLVRLDRGGDVSWTRLYPPTEGLGDGNSVEQTPDGGFAAIGGTNGPKDENDTSGNRMFLVKTDAVGNMAWKRKFGIKYGNDGYCVRMANDGGYVLAGWTQSYSSGNGDGWVVRTDPAGRELWTKVIGTGDAYDDARSAQQTEDGGYIATGMLTSLSPWRGSLYLLKLAPEGK